MIIQLVNRDFLKFRYSMKKIFAAIAAAALCAGWVAEAKAADTIRFTWQGATTVKSFSIRATSGKSVLVDWGNSVQQTVTGNGPTSVTVRQPVAYASTGSYNVTITGADNDAKITLLSLVSNSVSSLDVSRAKNLSTLYCYSNQLSSLDVSHNTALTDLRCYSNPIGFLDVSNNTALSILYCYDNKLSSLDVTGNTALTDLSCYTNQLVDLDVSHNTELTALRCYTNQLTSLDVSSNLQLTGLYCFGNKLTSLDVAANVNLTILQCYSNQLTSLDVSNNLLLSTLYCYSNKLASLDLTNNSQLSVLRCYSNQLPLNDLYEASCKIAADANKRLGTQTMNAEMVTVGESVLITVDTLFGNPEQPTQYVNIKKNAALATAGVDYALHENRITFLSSGAFTLEAINDSITSEAAYPAKQLFSYRAIPAGAGLDTIRFTWKGDAVNPKSFNIQATDGTDYTVDWGNGDVETHTGTTSSYITVTQPSSYGNTNLYTVTVTTLDPACRFTYLNVSSKSVSALGVGKAPLLATLYCYSNQLSSLDVSRNKALTYLSCYANPLTTIDVSHNKDLATLLCYSNQLSSLDVSQNTALVTLYCYTNKLTTLDVSHNTALKTLYCYTNQLASLDLSQNTALTTLHCYNNLLSSLDLTHNTALTILYCYNNRLPLADLYAASRRISTIANKQLGTQNPTMIMAGIGERLLITPDTLLGAPAKATRYSAIKRNGAGAVSGTDYVLTGNRITLLKSGTYSMEATNDSIVSAPGFPALSLVTFGVQDAHNDTITFTWLSAMGAKSFAIQATEGKDFTVSWGDGGSATYTGTSANLNPTKDYGVDGNPYTVTVTTSDPDCHFTFLDVSSQSLSELRVRSASFLTGLNCNGNQLTSLDLSANSALTSVNCYSNQITSLDVSRSTNLATLYCYSNKLTSLNLGANIKLATLYCYSNQLATLDVTANTGLKLLYCYSNKLVTLDVSHNTALTSLICYANLLTSLDVRANTALTSLQCYSNKLSSLDVRSNTKLTSLVCYSNQLTSLDVSQNVALTSLQCHSNKLTALDLSANVKLTTLYCNGNQLPLKDLYLASQRIAVEANKRLGPQAFDAVILPKDQQLLITPDTLLGAPELATQYGNIVWNGLPAALGQDYSLTGSRITFLKQGTFTLEATNSAITSNSSYPAMQLLTYKVYAFGLDSITFTWTGSSTLKRGFDIQATPGTRFTVDWGNGLTTAHDATDEQMTIEQLAPYGTSAVRNVTITSDDPSCLFTYLDVSSKYVSALNVSRATLLTTLKCASNTISSLDVTHNTSLTTLLCNSNPLRSLDVSKNTILGTLYCYSNQLSSLDVSQNRALTVLQCQSNTLSVIDVSQNVGLKTLYCQANMIDTLDLNHNTSLTSVYCYSNRLTLGNLYGISQKISSLSYKRLGTQARDMVAVNTGQLLLLTPDTLLGSPAVATAYTNINRDGVPAEPTDYSLSGNYITFHSSGAYTIDATNSAISSYAANPAMRRLAFGVLSSTQSIDSISFTWTGAAAAKNFAIQATSGRTFKVDWGNTTSATYTGEGAAMSIFPSVTYGDNSSYTVTITTADTLCRFTLLDVSSKSVSLLDVREAAFLTSLTCHTNQLNSLNLSNNTALTSLYCYNNQLTSLNVSRNTALTLLHCYGNPLGSLDLSSNTALTSLYCYSNQLSSLDVSNNVALTSLLCYTNQLTSLDVSHNTALGTLSCYANQLTALDVTQNTALTNLRCYDNQLTSLDVSRNTAMSTLYCYNNQLTSLDISRNTNLASLFCHNNKLSRLDISHNPKLASLYCYGNKLPLKDLYAVSRKIAAVASKQLGTQTLDTATAYINRPLLVTADTLLGNPAAKTKYLNVKKGGVAALAGVDYQLTGNRITFLASGIYSLEASNDSITSHTPAKLLLTYRVPFAVHATAGPGGTISPAGDSTVAAGSSVSYTIQEDTGYAIDSVFVNKVYRGSISAYTFNNIMGDSSIHAKFRLLSYTVSAAAGANGRISPEGDSLVAHAGSIHYAITPNTGYHVDSVLVNGVNRGRLTEYTFSNVYGSDSSIRAVFAINRYRVSATAGANGSITPGGDSLVAHGAGITYHIAATTEGYHVDSVLVNGVNRGRLTSYTFNNVCGDSSIRAVFAINRYKVTAVAGANGRITPAGDSLVAHGAGISYHIAATTTGYHVDSVLVNGRDVPSLRGGATATYTFGSVKGDSSIRVVFAINQYTITAITGPNGKFSPESNSQVMYGGNITYTAQPNPGYEVDTLIVGRVKLDNQTSHTFLNVRENDTIRVVFRRITYTITASAGSNGRISPEGDSLVLHGNSVLYTFIPNSGYVVDSVIVNGFASFGGTSYVFTQVRGDASIRVSFKPTPRTVIATAGVGGGITPAGASSVNYGDSIAYHITANSTHEIDSVIVNGVYRGALAKYTFYNVCGDSAIRAVFKPRNFTVRATAGAHGSISPSGESTVKGGTGISYSITPEAGYTVEAILINGVPRGAFTSYTFTNVLGDSSIYATFTTVDNDTTIYSITINGVDVTSDMHDGVLRIAADCGMSSINISVDIAPTSSLTVNGVPSQSGSLTYNIDKYGHNVIPIEVTALNRLVGKYTLIVEAPMSTANIVYLWPDMPTINCNPATNGGYTFTAFQWYDAGGNLLVGENRPYLSSATANVYCAVTTSEGDVIHTCPLAGAPASATSLRAYPNPTGGSLTVEGLSKAKSQVEVYSLQGVLMGTFPSVDGTTNINLTSLPAGSYVVRQNAQSVVVIKK